MEARLLQAGLLKRLIINFSSLLTDIQLDCTDTGITMESLDSSHVCLVACFLNADKFHHYRCERPIPLGINVKSFLKILKLAKNEDIITLKTEQKAGDAPEVLTIMIESPQQQSTTHFSLKLMSLEMERITIPDTIYQCNVQMLSEQFDQIMTDVKDIGSTVAISIDKEAIRFGIDADIGSGTITCRSDTHVLIRCAEPLTRQFFSVKFIKLFSCKDALSPHIMLRLSPDVPMVLEYKFPDQLGHIRFYLAPKIED